MSSLYETAYSLTVFRGGSSLEYITVDTCEYERERVVLHDKIFTTEVDLCLVLQAITKYAFAMSPYLIIVTAEIRMDPRERNE